MLAAKWYDLHAAHMLDVEIFLHNICWMQFISLLTCNQSLRMVGFSCTITRVMVTIAAFSVLLLPNSAFSVAFIHGVLSGVGNAFNLG